MGNVNVNGGALEWTAVLDDNGIDQALSGLNQKLEETARKQVQQADQAAKAQQQYAQTIIQTGQAFRNLGDNIQGQFKTLGSLTNELQKVKDAQNELTKRKDLGIVGTETANNSMAALLAKELELSSAIEKVSQDMQTSDAIMKAASGSIIQRTLQLQQLKQEYQNLSEADRNSASIGGGLLTKIQGIDAELKAVNQSFQAVEQHAVGSINAKVSELSKIKSEYSALAETDRNSDIGKTMLSNIQRIEKEVEVLNNSFKTVPQKAVGSLNGKVAQLNELKNKFAELSELDRKSDIGRSLAKNIKGLDKEIQNINREFSATNNLASKAAIAIGSYLTFSAGTNFIKDIVRVRGEFQQLEVAFTTLLGSKEKADKLMNQVAQFAATTPFELDQVAGATKQLLAFGISSDKVISTLRSLGDVSAGIGAPLGDIAYLFGTIKTQGVALTQDVRQFASRGIPIYEELAKVLQVNVEQVGDFITAGKVGFPEIEKAFQNMTAEGSKFGGLMDAQSKTLTGQLSNLSDAWTRMLNDIGKGGENVFSDAIQAATSLVKNYQTVLDVVKVLALTYGTYKAALILTNVAAATLGATTKSLTALQILQAGASGIANKTMAVLNKTMLANPYVLAATAVAAFVSALIIFSKQAKETKTSAELLAKAQEDAGDRIAETESKIRPYLDALKNANITEQERVTIYNKLKDIDPQLIKNLDAKTLSYEKLAGNVKIYLDELRKQYALEANKTALQESIKIERDIENRIKRLNKLQQDQANKNKSFKPTFGGADVATDLIGEANLKAELKRQQESLAVQKQTSEELGQAQVTTETKTQEAKKRTLKVIDEEIAAQKKAQSEFSTTSTEYQNFQKKINVLEEERKRIVGESKKEISAANSLESKTNSLLEERKNLLEAIAALQRDARQSGLSKEQSELDRINEKYDLMIGKIVDFNKKTDDFNRKNRTNVQKFGLIDFATVNDTRIKELGNTGLIKQGSENFKKDLDQQKKVFDDFQSAVKDIGVEKAQEIFGEQTKGFTSFLSFLQAEAKKNINLINPEKIKQINEAIVAEQKKDEEELFKERFENYKRLLSATASFNQQRLAFEKQYEKDVVNLKKEFSGQELEERLQVLKDVKDADLRALGENIAAHTKGWRTLNQNLVNFTKQRIQQEIDALRKILQSSNISDETRQAIKDAINQWEDLKHSIDGSDDKINQFISDSNKVAGVFDAIGNSVEGVNTSLAESLKFISSMVSGVANAASAWKDFQDARDKQKNGTGSLLDTIVSGAGVIGAVLGVVNAVVGVFKKAKESKKEAQSQIAEFNAAILSGEFAITQEYRQRQREQVKLNELKLKGLDAERKLLEEQKKSVANQYNDLFKQIQQQTAVISETTKKTGGIFGIGAKTKVVQITESLAGKTFDQLEELFNKGQLLGKAKELFEQLQKIKQEGADIDALLEENKRNVQEAFTGTAAETITDSIVDGFRNGLHSAADFADNFQQLMQNALLQSLKFQVLEGPIKELFEQFATSSQSGGKLTKEEIAELQRRYNAIINNANKQFEQLQQIAGVNFTSGTGGQQQNTLVGQFKTLSEDTGNLLAGQFGGLRLTAIDQLNIMKQALQVQQNIESNTANTVMRLESLVKILTDSQTGFKKLKVEI